MLHLFSFTQQTLKTMLLTAALFLMSACNAEQTVEEAPVAPPVPVEVWSLDQTPAYTLKEVGTVKAFTEVEVVAKAGGIVEELNVKVGDTVSVDKVLGKVEQSSNDAASINLSNATNQLNNAKRNYDEAAANNQNVVNQAKLRAENLEVSLARLERNLRELESGNMNTEESLALQVSNAEKNVENAQVNLSNLENQFGQSWEDFFRDAEISLDSLFVKANSYYQTTSNIINPGNQSSITNDSFSYLLGAGDSMQRNETIHLYNQFTQELEQEQAHFGHLTPLYFDNFNEALDTVNEVIKISREMNQAMRILLENSLTSVDLTQAKLDAYKTQVAQAEAGSLQDQTTINALESGYRDLERQKETQLATAENNLTVAQNQLSDARNKLDQFNTTGTGSVKDLENQIAATKNDLATAYLDYENAIRSSQMQNSGKELEIQTYENQVKLAQKSVEDATIKAPISGIVSEVFIDAGDNVNPGSPVVKINQQDQLKVVFYVTERQAQWLTPGQTVKVTINDVQKTELSGRLMLISPAADAQNRKIKVEAAFDDKLLRPEMFVNVQVEVSEAVFDSSQFYLPLNAVVFEQNQNYVFVAEIDAETGEMIAVKKPVTTGAITEKWVHISEGLTGSEQVIVKGGRALQNGEKVQVLTAESSAS